MLIRHFQLVPKLFNRQVRGKYGLGGFKTILLQILFALNRGLFLNKDSGLVVL